MCLFFFFYVCDLCLINLFFFRTYCLVVIFCYTKIMILFAGCLSIFWNRWVASLLLQWWLIRIWLWQSRFQTCFQHQFIGFVLGTFQKILRKGLETYDARKISRNDFILFWVLWNQNQSLSSFGISKSEWWYCFKNVLILLL